MTMQFDLFTPQPDSAACSEQDDRPLWRSMDSAPKESYPIQHVQLLMQDGKVVRDAHWACDMSGAEQPPFRGWFIPVRRDNGTVSYYTEACGTPQGWAPMPPLNAQVSNEPK